MQLGMLWIVVMLHTHAHDNIWLYIKPLIPIWIWHWYTNYVKHVLMSSQQKLIVPIDFRRVGHRQQVYMFATAVGGEELSFVIVEFKVRFWQPWSNSVITDIYQVHGALSHVSFILNKTYGLWINLTSISIKCIFLDRPARGIKQGCWTLRHSELTFGGFVKIYTIKEGETTWTWDLEVLLDSIPLRIYQRPRPFTALFLRNIK